MKMMTVVMDRCACKNYDYNKEQIYLLENI